MKKTISTCLAVLLFLLVTLSFASCDKPNADPDAAVQALKDADYEDVAKRDSRAVSVDGVEWHVSGIRIKAGLCEWVEIYYFEDAVSANEAWEEVQEIADKWFDGSDPENYGSAFACKKSGNMIYFGTKNGIKDAK